MQVEKDQADCENKQKVLLPSRKKKASRTVRTKKICKPSMKLKDDPQGEEISQLMMELILKVNQSYTLYSERCSSGLEQVPRIDGKKMESNETAQQLRGDQKMSQYQDSTGRKQKQDTDWEMAHTLNKLEVME